jgi:peptidoglycan hydrolase-like protein with peptidoglycan-binding domain
MAKANSTNKQAPKATVTVAAVPAPKAAATPAAATPAAATPATFTGFVHPVTAAQVQHFINSQCAGQPAYVGIVALPNMPAGSLPPFLRKATGQRAAIVNALLWGFANGHTGPVNMAGAYAHFGNAKLATAGWADLVALLNGGFSASSKTWGQPFAKLVPLPGAATPAA